MAALALLIAGPARAGDAIHFDPSGAFSARVVEEYEAATDTCMRGRAQTLLYAGERSKNAVVGQIVAMCGPSMRQVFVQRAGFSPSQANAAIETMAWRALRYVMQTEGATE